MSPLRGTAGPVTVVVTRRVRAGCESEFEARLREFVAATATGPGQLGVLVVRPVPAAAEREYGILRRFASDRARAEFYASPAFVAWQAAIAPLTDGPACTEVVTGMEAWFAVPGSAAPRRWRMACVTLLGVYPLSLLLPWLLRPVLQRVPAPLDALLVASAMVASLTWLVMPRLARLLHSWLHPHRSAAPPPAGSRP